MDLKIIAGLGNPSKGYKTSRHNVGSLFIDYLAFQNKIEFEKKENLLGLIAKTKIDNRDVLILKPLVFMNESGITIGKALKFFKLKPVDLLVIQDDSDLIFKTIKLVRNRNSAGHHGIESIISNLKTKDFFRLRIGIRDNGSKAKAEEFVLNSFTNQEMEILEKEIFPKALDIVINWLKII